MYYRLENHKALKCASIKEWASWYSSVSRKDLIVARSKVRSRLLSTVFTGIDIGFSKESGPAIFETMEFIGKKATNLCILSSTWDEAKRIHLSEVRKWKSPAKQPKRQKAGSHNS